MDRGQDCVDVCVVMLAERGELCVRPDPPHLPFGLRFGDG